MLKVLNEVGDVQSKLLGSRSRFGNVSSESPESSTERLLCRVIRTTKSVKFKAPASCNVAPIISSSVGTRP